MRDELMENEDSAVLGLLMSFKEPPDVQTTLVGATQVSGSILHGYTWPGTELNRSDDSLSDQGNDQEDELIDAKLLKEGEGND